MGVLLFGPEHSDEPALQLKHMVHGAGAVAEVEHGGQAAGNVGFGPLHRGGEVVPFGQIGRNGAGQGAAGAVGVGVRDPLPVEPLGLAVPPEQVVGVVHLVAAFAEDCAAVGFADLLGRGLHPGGVGDGQTGQDLRFRDVRRHDLGHGQQLFSQGGDGVIPQQLGAGGGHHHGVHHDVLGLVETQPFGDGLDEGRRGHHADLHGIGEDVGENGVQLLGQKMRRRLEDVGHAGGVLGGQGGDGAHGEDAVGRHRLDVGLNARAAAGIAARNGQCSVHEKRPLFAKIIQPVPSGCWPAPSGSAGQKPVWCARRKRSGSGRWGGQRSRRQRDPPPRGCRRKSGCPAG